MKFTDGNSQLGTGEHSTTTTPRRNIPMTGAKYGGSEEKKYLTEVVNRIVIMQCNIRGRLRVEC